MLKKSLAVLLSMCAVLCCMLPAAAAQEDMGVIRVTLHSDIAGLTENDTEKLIEIRSDNVVYTTLPCGPVSISDYAGTMETGVVKAGRSYTIDYYLDPAEGYTLPETLTDGDVEIECGKGVTVISTQITTDARRDDNGNFTNRRALHIYAVVVVDGSILQRIVGWLYDIYLKMRAWSLY